LIPLSLYIHIPWCVRKCPYCDFNSHEIKKELPEAEYISALVRDLEQELPAVWGRKIQSIFIGGGTPSTLSPESYDALFSQLRARLIIMPDTEITMEVNPGTVDQYKLSEYQKTGVNRLSIGAQSFNNDLLQRIGRIHDRRAAFNAVESAHHAGFENINLDIMFGLPTQTIEQGQSDIKNAIALEPTHISFYELTIEPNTLFYKQPPTLPTENKMIQIQETGKTLLSENGFQQYEISAYAKSQRQCKHNLNYWQFGDYIGIGAGAHGKITSPENMNITRRAKLRSPQDYMDKAGLDASVSSTRELSDNDRILEFMMNALRLNDGFPVTLFEERTGLDIALIEDTINKAMDNDLIEQTSERLRPTEKGRNYLNDLTQLFMAN